MLASLFGFFAVALGAFGAHGLSAMLDGASDAAKRLEWWHTGARYHLVHSLAIGFAAWLTTLRKTGTFAVAAGYLFSLGVVIFSGTLYLMALGGPRWLGAITPFGGLTLLAGWTFAGLAGFKGEFDPPAP